MSCKYAILGADRQCSHKEAYWCEEHHVIHCPTCDAEGIERIDYFHDGWTEATLTMRRLGGYRLELEFTDATDYERTILFLREQYKRAIKTQRRFGEP